MKVTYVKEEKEREPRISYEVSLEFAHNSECQILINKIPHLCLSSDGDVVLCRVNKRNQLSHIQYDDDDCIKPWKA